MVSLIGFKIYFEHWSEHVQYVVADKPLPDLMYALSEYGIILISGNLNFIQIT